MAIKNRYLRLLPALSRFRRAVCHKAGIWSLDKQASALARAYNRKTRVSPTVRLSLVVRFDAARVSGFRNTMSSLSLGRSDGVEVIIAVPLKHRDEAERHLNSSDWSIPCRIVLDEGPTVPLHAIKDAKSEYFAILESGAEIVPHALGTVRRMLGSHGTPSLLYTDSLQPEQSSSEHSAQLNPAFDPVLLESVDYISSTTFYSRAHLATALSTATGAIATARDLLNLYIGTLDETQIVHLPFPVFRLSPLSETAKISAAAEPDKPQPFVSVIIPSRNEFELISRALSGLFDNTDYPNLEVIVIDNGSSDPRVLELYEAYRNSHKNFRVFIHHEKFNFSRSINKGISYANGDHITLVNNDIEVVEKDWLTELVSCLSFANAGIVGAKLLYPNGTIQHAGVIVGLNDLASHWFYKEPGNTQAPISRLRHPFSVTCVTGAVMLISGECLKRVGAWDEGNFAVAYNDVDYCLRARQAGFRAIMNPRAVLTHHESVSRAKDKSLERRRAFAREKKALRQIHCTAEFADPAFSPWYQRKPGKLAIKCPAEMPECRTWWD